MENMRVKTINIRLRDLQKQCTELAQLLEPEHFRYENLEAELQHKKGQLESLLGDIRVSNMEKDKILQEASEERDRIINAANVMGKSIEQAAYNRLTESKDMLESVKKFCMDVNKKQYMELNKEIAKKESELKEKE